MPLITKPDFTYVWASGGAVVAPNDAKKQLGWVAEAPPFQYDNWLQNRQDQMLAHVNQHGIPVWDAVTEYQAGKSYTQGSNGVIYVATQTHTNQNPVSAPTYWEALISHGIIKSDTAGVSSWTVPLTMKLGIIKPKVTLVAGGGGGSRVDPASGGGGAAGGASTKVVDLTGVTSVTITVGAGGTGAATTGANGGTGGTSSFGAIFSATGGIGGAGSSGTGGVGGSGVGGDINIQGAPGVNGTDGYGGRYSAGSGGSSQYGGGGRGSSATANVNGADGVQGGGGAGGTLVGTGGAGGAGIVVIEW